MRVLVASATVHLALLALVMHEITRDERVAQARTAPIARAMAPPVDSAPIEIAILPADRPIAPTPAPAPAIATAGTATGAATEAVVATSSVPARGGDGAYVRMVEPPQVGGMLDRMLAAGAAGLPDAAKTGIVNERGDDRATIYDTVSAVETGASARAPAEASFGAHRRDCDPSGTCAIGGPGVGAVDRAARSARSAEYMRKNLDALATAHATPRARRAVLFELWDECDEGDGVIGEAGQRDRAMVIGWIRALNPRTTRDAFTDDELAAMNARRSSTQRFAPY